MAVFADCPACMGGNHEGHVEHWGKRPEGVIDGEFCHCPGDCAERVAALFEPWLKALAEPPAEHLLLGSACSCGEWSAGCGNNIPEQWRQHVNAAEGLIKPPGASS